MKKLLEKTDLLAGIFAIVAVVAIICEVSFGGFTKESIVGGIKDITGIIVDVLVFVVAASVLLRKPMDFREKFRKEMNKIAEKYSPLLVEDKKEGCIRYNIASNSDALFTGETKKPERIFELVENKPKEICFYINKSFFVLYTKTLVFILSTLYNNRNTFLEECLCFIVQDLIN